MIIHVRQAQGITEFDSYDQRVQYLYPGVSVVIKYRKAPNIG